jgi:Kef-type K+ transport system membrane component KefB
MNLILAIGILIVTGFGGGLLARKIKFPRISGYIIIGILLSPSLLNIIPSQLIRGELSLITDIALGIIAYLIGGSLKLERLKGLGRGILAITAFQSLGAWLFVGLLVAFLGHLLVPLNLPHASYFQTYLPMAIIIGAVSCATAPAATLAIVREYRASGPFTTTLLGVVALDDAVAILGTSVAISFSRMLIAGESISPYSMLLPPVWEIAGSLVLGVGVGFVLIHMSPLAKTRKALLALVFGMIMLCVGLSRTLGVSPLLANMAVGFVIVNRMKQSEQLFGVIDDIEDVIFAMFFTLAGTHFDLRILSATGVLSLLIILGRFSGKFLGARIGSSLAHAPESVRKYLGLGLFPKAGVTVGLILLVQREPTFSAIGNLIISAVLASVIINELIAPPLTKYAIVKAGEAKVFS